MRKQTSRRSHRQFSRSFFEALEGRRLLSVPDNFPAAVQHPAGSGNYATGHSGHTVSWIVIHTTESTAASTINEFTTAGIQVSANYMVERNGVIDQFVSNNNTAYHCGNLAYNESSIGIEHERYTQNNVQFDPTEQEYEASANLVRWLSSFYNIPLMHLAASVAPANPASGTDIIGHYQVPDPNNPSLGGGANHHTDPVHWDWTHYIDLLNSTTTPLMPVIIGVGAVGSTPALASTTQTFSWMPVLHATGYTITLKDTTAGTTSTFNVAGSATSLQVSLTNHHNFSWSMTSAINSTKSIASPTYTFSINAPTGSPFGGTPFNAGSIVQAENFNTGGEGVAYHDTDAVNSGGQYRPGEGVDIEKTTDTGGGYDVGWTHTGEYLNYTGNFASAGNYAFSARIANFGTGGLFHVNIDGVNVTGTLAVPNTGAFQKFTNVGVTSIPITAGSHVVQIVFDGQSASGFSGNLNNFSFMQVSGAEGPFGGTPWSLPGTVQAENYDTGGESIAFHDTTANNEGGAYRTGVGDGVDIEAGASGFDVGWTHAAEWMKYTVNVTAGGTYTFDAHVANAAAGGAFHVEVDGVNVTGSLAVPNTGSFKTYTDVLKSGISLTAGSHVIRWVWDANTQYGFAGNLDWFKFS